MSVRVRNTGADFTPAPEGLHLAVCCDVVELGLQETQWGRKRKIDIKFQIDELMENGKPFLVTKRYGASLHPKATLRIDLESWRSRPFTDTETEDFELEVLLGVGCQINVVHNRTDAGTFANIKAIVPLPKGTKAMKVRDYVRVCQREGYEAPDMDETDSSTETETQVEFDDDIPF